MDDTGGFVDWLSAQGPDTINYLTPPLRDDRLPIWTQPPGRTTIWGTLRQDEERGYDPPEYIEGMPLVVGGKTWPEFWERAEGFRDFQFDRWQAWALPSLSFDEAESYLGLGRYAPNVTVDDWRTREFSSNSVRPGTRPFSGFSYSLPGLPRWDPIPPRVSQVF